MGFVSFQIALSDFVAACLEAHAEGIALLQLQLQMILAEGALPPEYTARTLAEEHPQTERNTIAAVRFIANESCKGLTVGREMHCCSTVDT